MRSPLARTQSQAARSPRTSEAFQFFRSELDYRQSTVSQVASIKVIDKQLKVK
jgi:hypothetical protein